MGLIARRRPAPDGVGEAAQRLSVLLRTGISPASAWAFLAATGDADAVAIHAAHNGGQAIPAAIAARGDRWRPLAATWRVAAAVGAPLAESLRAVAAAVRDAQECRDEVRVALAEPAATARLMAWLPLVSIGLGVALGFDTIGVLMGSPIGIGCLIAGITLMIVARVWTGALSRRATPPPAMPGLHAELVAIALSGGVSIERARALADPEVDAPDPGLDALLQLSRSAGVPAVELLRAGASLARHRARTDGRMRAAGLGAALLLPLGVCILPAFLLLGVAPMLMSVLGTSALPL
ncbi:type II secretion system F family protein [Microbacterium sp. BG28]|uniref:type II secretion system F family protein n=1 Tax=Microbacterium sp. BG28 TaxID=3097356 RepID=UPI002A5A6B7A|nr:type II secretion system F family protein [Microbacterium sp. BG28]MDY0827590.1 type II secretion system F family protein [Microbacterium sp. BG28]